MSNPSKKDAENFSYILIISGVATLGGFLFGFDSGVINGTVDGLKLAFHSNDVASGFNVASMLLGCAVGAFFAGRLADLNGRRAMLRVAAIFFIVSAWGSGIAASSFEFIIYRVLGGLAVGAASVMSPAYIAEVAPARCRGALATVQQVAIITGLFIAFLSNYVLVEVSGSAINKFWLGYETWRWMFWMELIPSAIFFITLLLIPESPRYLVVKHKSNTALKVLQKLYGSVAADAKLNDIVLSLADNNHGPRFSDLIDQNRGKIRLIVWIGVGLATFQQFVGINVIFYYGAVLWQAVGFDEGDSLLINVLSGALSIGAVILSLVLIDKVGRKPLLLIGSIGMAVSLAVVSLAFTSATKDAAGSIGLGEGMGVLALIAANIYVVFFNVSWGPVMWVLLGEMFPNQIRGSCLAIAGLAQWGSNFLVSWTFPMLLTSMGLAFTYSLYMLCAIISIFFVIRFVYETRGVELEHMRY